MNNLSLVTITLEEAPGPVPRDTLPAQGESAPSYEEGKRWGCGSTFGPVMGKEQVQSAGCPLGGLFYST